MTDETWLADRFEERRPKLRAVAYRMLGSSTEADDAVQDAWLRVATADATAVQNLDGWFTTIVARVCLNVLRTRRTRREEALGDGGSAPALRVVGGTDPEAQAVMADAVGLALLVVLETLGPDERLAFVLHDLFAVPFDEIAPIVDRTPAAARQLASRARRRVRGATPGAAADLDRQRKVIDAFIAASRAGDFEALLKVLHPDVVVRTDGRILGPDGAREFRGANAVAQNALSFRRLAGDGHLVLIDGRPAVLVVPGGKPFALLTPTIDGDRIRAIDVTSDPDVLARVAAVLRS